MNITLISGSSFVGTSLATRLIVARHNVIIADKNDSKNILISAFMPMFGSWVT
jgi:predicted dinucleotide-binding enzyme